MKQSKFLKKEIIFIILLVIIFFSACNTQVESENDLNNEDITSTLKQIESQDLDPIEIEGLLFMREEEKLARDVYIVLYDLWSLKVFNNISKSEQKHTDIIKVLLEKYELVDPVESDEVGVFKNEDLKLLYSSLIIQGKESLIGALEVAAAIEEIDILDLEKFTEKTDNEDILYVYENLARGSRNHLRAFVKNIEILGVEYTPQFIESDQYLTIISGEFEKGGSNCGSKGWGKGRGHKGGRG